MRFAYISDLAVLEECRGHGLGRGLLEAAVSFAKSKGTDLVRIGVLAENRPVRRMYEKSGFVEHKIVLETEF